MSGLFVTGTDTGVGKTVTGCALLAALGVAGLRTAAMKPVASGCRRTPQGLRNDDAEALMAAAGVRHAYDQVNPVALEPAVAPHLAAMDAGVTVDVPALVAQARRLEADADLLLVEGAGGWRVPLGANSGFSDLARELGYPVVLVVAIRLGCINHALLTAEAVQRDGLALAGWVANVITEGEPLWERQIDSLDARLPAPRLGTLPPRPGAGAADLARHLDVSGLGKTIAANQ